MQLDLIKSSKNRDAMKGVKEVYHCAYCSKLSGRYSKNKRKITHRLVHSNLGIINQFCCKSCKEKWLEMKIRENS